MNTFHKGGVALTLALLAAAIPHSSQANPVCYASKPWFAWASTRVYPPGHGYYALAGLLGMATQWGYANRSKLSPKMKQALALAKSKFAKTPKKVSMKSRMAKLAGNVINPAYSVIKPFGDRPQYASGYYKPAQKGKWLFTRTDKQGNRFATDWMFRPIKGNAWSGKSWVTTPAQNAQKARIAAIQSRFGKGRIGNAALGVSNFMNKHSLIGNALYYPALAAAGYYGYKGAELVAEKLSDLWVDYQANDLFSAIIDKANEQFENPDVASLKSPLSTAVLEDTNLQTQISSLSAQRQVALKAAMAQFDKAFGLQNLQARAAALHQALDRIRAICETA